MAKMGILKKIIIWIYFIPGKNCVQIAYSAHAIFAINTIEHKVQFRISKINTVFVRQNTTVNGVHICRLYGPSRCLRRQNCTTETEN